MKKTLNKKGLTLLEIIITIAIISIIIPVAFSVFGFGNSTFKRGISRRDIQQNVRNISSLLVDEIRYANKDDDVMDIVKQIPIDSYRDEKTVYIVVDSEGISKYEGKNLEPSFRLGNNTGIKFEWTEIKVSDDLRSIKIKLTGKEGDSSYDVESSVVPLNGNIENMSGNTDGNLLVRIVPK